jgi:7-cyano-7-deazaguanine reductase
MEIHVARTTKKTAPKGKLTQLGKQAIRPTSPDKALIEKVKNPHKGVPYCVRFTCPEFTSLCPITDQPDFAHLVIDYVPDGYLVESKSLKLFLGSFRNHGAFHEDCTVAIALRLIEAVKPLWLRIGGYWYPRGGIPIDIFYQTGPEPDGVWIPSQDVLPYKGRG